MGGGETVNSHAAAQAVTLALCSLPPFASTGRAGDAAGAVGDDGGAGAEGSSSAASSDEALVPAAEETALAVDETDAYKQKIGRWKREVLKATSDVRMWVTLQLAKITFPV